MTARETQILSMLTASLSYKEIAARTHLSPNTVGNHLARIREKLGAPTTVDLVLYWVAQHSRRAS